MLPLLMAVTTCLGVMFIAYVLFILIPFLRHPASVPGRAEDFDFHFFIPCRDEAAVIATTIERARRDFPVAHVWVIDDDSNDDTSTIAQRYARADDHVHVVQRRRPQARTGKGDALNSAYHHLNDWLPTTADRKRIVVGVIDADGELAENALRVVAADDVFGDSTIGAAQVAVWMMNRADPKPFAHRGRLVNLLARWLLRMQDLEFRTVIAAMQSLRSRTGTVGLGGNGQFARLSVLDTIRSQYGAPWHGALLEDYELGIHVLLAGSQVKHVYDTHVSQEALPSFRRLLTQRTRWAQGNIQCVRYIPDIVRSRHFDSAGVLETCYYLILPFLQVLGLICLLTLTGFAVAHSIANPAVRAGQLHNAGLLLALSAIFGVGPFALWGPVYKRRCEPQTSWPMAFAYGLGLWLYVYYMYICIVRAFARVILGRNGWAKTRRNSEANLALGGSVAIER